jgi:porin
LAGGADAMSMNRRFPAYLVALSAWCIGVHASGLLSLGEDGIEFHFGYISQTATNVQGGDRQLWRYADEWAFTSTLDLQKLFGLNQAQFRITLTDRNGRNLSTDAHLGSLQEVQGIYGRGQTWHWTQFSYDEKYLDGVLDWKIGRLVGGEDFADFPCEFMNLALCGPPPGNIAVSDWYNWPVSQWATRLRVSLKGFGYVQVGAYEANPNYLLTSRGLDLGTPGGSSGVLVPVEVAWQPVFGDRFEGSYKFGAWYNSSRTSDVAEPVTHRGNYGGYVNFLQRLTAPLIGSSRRGISVFLNATFVDRRTATLDSQIATGVFWTGLFASRPADKLGVAFGRTHVNSRVGTAERFVPSTAGRSEYVGEVFYAIQATPWLDLRPTVQYVHQPGGIDRNRDDVIAGLRISINL